MLDKHIEGINHIALQVSDLQAALRFFHELLGFKIKMEVEFEGLRITNLKAGKIEIELWENESQPPAPRPAEPLTRTGVNHIAITVKNLDAVVQALQAEGYELALGIHEVTRGIREAVFYGPDNIEVQFVEENVPLLIWRSIKGDFRQMKKANKKGG